MRIFSDYIQNQSEINRGHLSEILRNKYGILEKKYYEIIQKFSTLTDPLSS